MTPLDRFNHALTLARQKDFEGALAAFSQLVEQHPAWPEAHYNLGRVFRDLGRFHESEAAYQHAVALRANYPSAWINLGNLYFSQGKDAQASRAYEQVVRFDPNAAESWFFLGIARQRLGVRDGAIDAFMQAVTLQPANEDWLRILSAALHNAGRIEEAANVYHRILQLVPGDPSATYSLGLIELAKGNFAPGWEMHEMRRRLATFRTMRSFPQPEWNGEAIQDKTILLHAEQGLGDTIQFIRYASMLTPRARATIFICPVPLVSLMEGRFGLSQVLPDGSCLPNFDLHVPLMSLPRIFKTTINTIPVADRYLSPRGEDRDLFDDAMTGVKPRIGLCWAGNPENPTDAIRSIPLECLAPIASSTDADLYCLQVGPAAGQVASTPLKLVDLRGRLTDLSKTAALINRLDLVITVDTAVAHLAAALGKPTWLLIAFAHDWRWMLDRSDSPWYPSMRIFRQTALGEWDSVVRQVVSALKEFRCNR